MVRIWCFYHCSPGSDLGLGAEFPHEAAARKKKKNASDYEKEKKNHTHNFMSVIFLPKNLILQTQIKGHFSKRAVILQ